VCCLGDKLPAKSLAGTSLARNPHLWAEPLRRKAFGRGTRHLLSLHAVPGPLPSLGTLRQGEGTHA